MGSLHGECVSAVPFLQRLELLLDRADLRHLIVEVRDLLFESEDLRRVLCEIPVHTRDLCGDLPQLVLREAIDERELGRAVQRHGLDLVLAVRIDAEEITLERRAHELPLRREHLRRASDRALDDVAHAVLRLDVHAHAAGAEVLLDQRLGTLRQKCTRHAEREANQLEQRRLAAPAPADDHVEAVREREGEALKEAASDFDGDDPMMRVRGGLRETFGHVHACLSD